MEYRLIPLAFYCLTGVVFSFFKEDHDQCVGWEGSFYFDKFCYKLITASQTSWKEAQTECAGDTSGGHLAEGSTEGRLTFMRELAMYDYSSEDIYVGGAYNATSKTFTWSQAGESGVWWWDDGQPDVVLPGAQSCVSISGGPGWRKLKNGDCDVSQMFMCQKYIGDPCEFRLPGGEYFNRACFKYVDEQTFIDGAEQGCEKLSSVVAEPWSVSAFDFVKQLVNRKAYTRLVVPANTGADIIPGDISLTEVQEVAVSVRTCGEARIVLHQGDEHSDYYEIVLGGNDNTLIQLNAYRGCQAVLLAEKQMASVLSCDQETVVDVKWHDYQQLEVTQFGLFYNFSEHQSDMLYISHLSAHMGDSAGEWVVGGVGREIFLGASDLVKEGDFRWTVAGRPVRASLWLDGQPTDWTNNDDVVMRGLEKRLANVNGTLTKASYICRKYVIYHSYVVALPGPAVDSGTSSYNIQVSSPRNELIFVFYAYRESKTTTLSFESFQGRNTSFSIGLPPSLVLTPSGLYQSSISLWGSNHVTVVVVGTSPETGLEAGTVILPSKELTGHTSYFVLTAVGDTHQIAVLSTVDGNDVTFSFSEDHTRNVLFKKGGLIYRSPLSGHVVLAAEEVLMLQSVDSLSGLMVHAAYTIAVFAGSYNSGTNVCDATLENILPVDYAGAEYISFPSIPVDETQVDTFQVVAVYDHTEIMIPGQDSIWLPAAGVTTLIELQQSGYHRLISDRPFLATKLGNIAGSPGPSGPCFTTLLPSNMWRSEYDFVITDIDEVVVFMMEAEPVTDSTILIDGETLPLTNMQCEVDTGDDLTGCIVPFTSVGAHVLSSATRLTFPAYLMSMNGETSYCRPLGLRMQLPTDPLLMFDPDAYLQSRTACNTTYPYRSSDVISTESTTEHQITSPAFITNQTILEPPSSESVHENIRRLRAELFVDIQTTSHYRRSKSCARDERLSSATIGVCGVTVLVSVCACLCLSDAINFIKQMAAMSSSPPQFR